MSFAASAFWLPLLEIIWIDILLSGDNAVVIALACRSLSERQRTWGVILGSGAAVVLRVVFTVLIVELLGLPFVKIAGGVLLLWIGVRLSGEEERQKEVAPANTLWSAIRIIAVADAVMSLDNMMAVAAAAKGSKLLILIGLALSIPLLVFGSTLVLALLNRFPMLVWAGAGLLGWIAGDLIGADPDLAAWLRVQWPSFDTWDGPAGAVFVPVIAWLRRRHKAPMQQAPQPVSKGGWGWPVAAAALAVLVFGGGFLTWFWYGGTTLKYVTQELERGPVVRTVTAHGVIKPTTIVPAGARVSGAIQALYCDVNMHVKADQLCAKIDPRPYQIAAGRDKADLAAAMARFEKHKAGLTQAKAVFERHEALAKRRAISRKVLDASRKAYERARTQTKRDEARIAQVQAALHAAEINLGLTNIVAPIDGTIISRNAALGQMVAAGPEAPPLFLVDPGLTVIQVDANARENDFGEIKPGDTITFTVEAFPNQPFAGEVKQIQTYEQATAYDVVIRAPYPDQRLKPGMRAAVKIVVDRRDSVLRAPNQALRYLSRELAVPSGAAGRRAALDGWSQLWILRDGQPAAITVQLGLDDGTYTEIVKGDLQPGDELIIGESGGVL